MVLSAVCFFFCFILQLDVYLCVLCVVCCVVSADAFLGLDFLYDLLHYRINKNAAVTIYYYTWSVGRKSRNARNAKNDRSCQNFTKIKSFLP
jgi:hypothetical protein